jgi:hypothetical protein
MPTFEDVTNPVVEFVNWTVFEIEFPTFAVSSRSYDGRSCKNPSLIPSATTLPRTVMAFDDVSSKNTFEPIESVFVGFAFAMPTFEVVTISLALSVAFVISRYPSGARIGI